MKGRTPIRVEVGAWVPVAKGTLEHSARVRGCESQGQIIQTRCQQRRPREQLRPAREFGANSNHFLNRRVHLAFTVHEIDSISAINLLLTGEERLDRSDFIVVHHEVSKQRGATWSSEPHRCRLVPHRVVGTEPLDEHQHIDRIDGPIHAAAEDRPHVVAGSPAQWNPNAHFAVVRCDVGDPSARSAERGEEIEGPFLEARSELVQFRFRPIG